MLKWCDILKLGGLTKCMESPRASSISERLNYCLFYIKLDAEIYNVFFLLHIIIWFITLVLHYTNNNSCEIQFNFHCITTQDIPIY
jgi:hypothetical protein